MPSNSKSQTHVLCTADSQYVASINSTMSLFGKTALPGYSRMSFRSYLILSRKIAYLNNGHKPDRAAIKIKFQNECQGKQLPRIEGDKRLTEKKNTHTQASTRCTQYMPDSVQMTGTGNWIQLTLGWCFSPQLAKSKIGIYPIYIQLKTGHI